MLPTDQHKIQDLRSKIQKTVTNPVQTASSANLLSPGSIAIIGASEDPSKIGHQVLANIVNGGYIGKVYPVNPHADKILGLPVYKSVSEIPFTVDMAIIVIPAPYVLPVVQECAVKKVPNLVIISAGFRETGKEGAKIQQEITKIAIQKKMNIIGPNCLGFMNTDINLNASFSATRTEPGNVIFFSQSGAFGTAVLDWANAVNLGFKYFISIGNKATVDENILLEMWHTQFAQTTENLVFAGYLEDFTNGRRFMDIASRLSKRFPIVILKPGKSSGAQQAISSHTGSLATEDKVVDAALTQSGCIRVTEIEQMFNTIQLLSRQSIPAGNRVAVITNAGGPSVTTIDHISDSPLVMAELSDTSKFYLSQHLPPAANVKNPVDVLGDAQADRYQIAMEAVLCDENVDSAIVLLTPQAVTQVEKTAGLICEISRKYPFKQIVPAFIGGSIVERGVSILNQYQMPIFRYPCQAVDAMADAYRYRRSLSQPLFNEENFTKLYASQAVISKIRQTLPTSQTNILGRGANDLIASANIPVPPSIFISSEEHLIEKRIEELGYPIVAKIISPKLLHKTELSAVKLNLANIVDIRNAVTELRQIWAKNFPYEKPCEIQLQKQIMGGENLIIGFKRAAGFGPVILFGAGGILTELYADTAERIAPLTWDDTDELINQTKVAKLLQGFRGSKPRDIAFLKDTLVKISDLALSCTEIKEFDINPFILLNQGEGGYAADVKIILEKTS